MFVKKASILFLWKLIKQPIFYFLQFFLLTWIRPLFFAFCDSKDSLCWQKSIKYEFQKLKVSANKSENKILLVLHRKCFSWIFLIFLLFFLFFMHEMIFNVIFLESFESFLILKVWIFSVFSNFEKIRYCPH
jgi:hypothetical protein